MGAKYSRGDYVCVLMIDLGEVGGKVSDVVKRIVDCVECGMCSI